MQGVSDEKKKKGEKKNNLSFTFLNPLLCNLTKKYEHQRYLNFKRGSLTRLVSITDDFLWICSFNCSNKKQVEKAN